MQAASQHAQIRCQQRGIAPFEIDLLLQFGARVPAEGSTEKLFLMSDRENMSCLTPAAASKPPMKA